MLLTIYWRPYVWLRQHAEIKESLKYSVILMMIWASGKIDSTINIQLRMSADDSRRQTNQTAKPNNSNNNISNNNNNNDNVN